MGITLYRYFIIHFHWCVGLFQLTHNRDNRSPCLVPQVLTVTLDGPQCVWVGGDEGTEFWPLWTWPAQHVHIHAGRGDCGAVGLGPESDVSLRAGQSLSVLGWYPPASSPTDPW